MLKNDHQLLFDIPVRDYRKKFPKTLIITAETSNKTVMGLMHKD